MSWGRWQSHHQPPYRNPSIYHDKPSSPFLPRVILATVIITAVFLPSISQTLLSRLYTYLYGSAFYRLSCFETIETILCYAIAEPLYVYRFGRNPHLRLDVRGEKGEEREDGGGGAFPKVPKMRRPSRRVEEFLIYAAPLLMMDFTMIKKFAGVSVSEIRESGGYGPVTDANANANANKNMNTNGTENISASFLLPTMHNFTFDSPLQLCRALPASPPSIRRLVLELLASIVIYDALFFLFHLAVHRIRPLARIHHSHHTHAEIHPQITNRLSIAERLALVMLANFSLNIIGSHVLTRTLFVPLFVYLLVEVHSGLDLPWGYDKILPEGWGMGSKVHAVHHRTGDGKYAPFFCWWDRALEWVEGDRSCAMRE